MRERDLLLVAGWTGALDFLVAPNPRERSARSNKIAPPPQIALSQRELHQFAH